jgi:hypothetical protein
MWRVRHKTPANKLKFSHSPWLHGVTSSARYFPPTVTTTPVTRDIIYGWIFKCSLARPPLVCGMKYHLRWDSFFKNLLLMQNYITRKICRTLHFLSLPSTLERLSFRLVSGMYPKRLSSWSPAALIVGYPWSLSLRLRETRDTTFRQATNAPSQTSTCSAFVIISPFSFDVI